MDESIVDGAAPACRRRLRSRRRAHRHLPEPPAPYQGSLRSITVWVDSVRLPAAKAYAAAHPNVNVKIVTFDGDANGATTLQTKIQLWNRTGKGWPDVIFSEQVNDPIWMAQPPFKFAEPDGPDPGDAAQQVARALDRPVHDQRPGGLRPGQPRPGRALGQHEADGQVRLHGPQTWQEWAALGQRSLPSIPATSSGPWGSRSATGSTCGPTSARRQISSRGTS